MAQVQHTIVHIPLPEDLHRRLKAFAVQHDSTMRGIILAQVEALLDGTDATPPRDPRRRAL